MLQINGISLHEEDLGTGRPVVLLHGWPDSSHLWRNQIPFLVKNGFRPIAPDLRGLGRSDRPEGVAAYALPNAVGDVEKILDALGIDLSEDQIPFSLAFMHERLNEVDKSLDRKKAWTPQAAIS